ncbi:MAG: hypothetical protein QM703_04810 [Gemmatales bacterium]
MAGYFSPGPKLPSGYQGLPYLFGYVNGDGRKCGTNCGLAASATMLTFLGKMAVESTTGSHSSRNMAELESTFPPNILGGLAGTSRGRVERILDAHGAELVEILGEEELRRSLHAGQPVAVMLKVPGNTVWGMTMPAGHWMVAYGCDEKKIYLTNWDIDGMTWEEFREGWAHLIPWCINMDRRGLAGRLAR